MYFVTLTVIQKQEFKILFQNLKKKNLPHFLVLEEVTKMVFAGIFLLTLPCKGSREGQTLCNITKEVNKILPNKHKAMLFENDTEVSSNFYIKHISQK